MQILMLAYFKPIINKIKGLFYLAPQGAPKFPRTPLPYIVIAKGIISTYEF